MRGIIHFVAALSIAVSTLCTSSFAMQPQVGDCIALMFTKGNSHEDARLRQLYAQAVEKGWAVRLVDGNTEASFAKRWRIENFPTIVLVRNSREFDRLFASPGLDDLSRRMLAASNPESLRVVNRAREAGVAPTVASQGPTLVRGQSPSPISPAVSLAISPAISPAANNSHTVAPTAVQSASHSLLPSNPAEATVRIRVDEPNSEVFGTGTIIDTHQGEALVLTCGHLFRDASSSARILVETFIGGVPKAHPAILIDFKADATDIGLVSFRPEGPVAVARLVDHREQLQEGESVYSWGCDNGQNPTRRDSRITKLNRYVGEPNVEVYGAPVQGRSGGGLFNSRGELIGVCYAADTQLNEGLYNAPQVVYNQLNRLGLQRLYNHKKANQASFASSDSALFQPAVPLQPAVPPQNPAGSPLLVTVTDEHGRPQQIQVTPEMLQAIRNQGSLIR